MSSGRKPDFEVSVARKVGEKWRSVRVGSAWKNDNGSIAIRIDPGIAVSTPEGVTLALWPPRERNERSGGRSARDDRDDFER